jgi:glycine/D-amino acid oxidase-like deaminating enzyme
MAESHDLIIIGGGSAGLTAAGFAAQLGVRVAIVENTTTRSQPYIPGPHTQHVPRVWPYRRCPGADSRQRHVPAQALPRPRLTRGARLF